MAAKNEVLSANEAASVTGVPLKQVHRIIDGGLLQGAVENRGGLRVILRRGLVGLKFAHDTAGLLSPEGRRRLVRRLLERPDTRTVQEDAVMVDVRPLETAVRRGLTTLEKAKKMATVDKDVLGGTPCFKGTRIPVHDIADMLTNGDGRAAILNAYPQLSAEQVDLAGVYAEAYPRRGRPRRQSAWRKAGVVSKEQHWLRDLSRS